MNKPFLAFIFFSILAGASSGQVLNIEQERIRTDTTGWSGNARVSFDIIKNQKQVLNLSGRFHVQFKTQRTLSLFLADYGFLRADRSDFSNSGFVHFRFNRKFRPWFTAEAFTQAQSNKILAVRFRGLLGAGPRFRIVAVESFRLYLAALPMFEHEELETAGIIADQFRLSSYASWTWKLSDIVTLVQTTYFQPRIDDPADFRTASQTDFLMRISKRFSISLSFNNLHDTRPPEGVVRSVYSFKNVLLVDFGG
ncbi:DUF481 domain-containing protein [bacterium]|nr:DUF481 domain-containing protein [bacterium]